MNLIAQASYQVTMFTQSYFTRRRPERLKENLAVFDFRLTGKEMDQISRMTIPNSRLISELQWVPRWD